MSKEQDYRFFGFQFQESWPGAARMVEDVGNLADQLIAEYGVDSFDDLPQEAKDKFEEQLQQREWPIRSIEEAEND